MSRYIFLLLLVLPLFLFGCGKDSKELLDVDPNIDNNILEVPDVKVKDKTITLNKPFKVEYGKHNPTIDSVEASVTLTDFEILNEDDVKYVVFSLMIENKSDYDLSFVNLNGPYNIVTKDGDIEVLESIYLDKEDFDILDVLLPGDKTNITLARVVESEETLKEFTLKNSVYDSNADEYIYKIK